MSIYFAEDRHTSLSMKQDKMRALNALPIQKLCVSKVKIFKTPHMKTECTIVFQ